MKGTIKAMNSGGYGFITCDGIDYFFHYTDYKGDWKLLLQRWLLARDSKEPIEVNFEFDRSSKSGPKAVDVTEIVGELK